MSQLSKIVFPSHDKTNGKVFTYKLEPEELSKYQPENIENRQKDYILIQQSSKVNYDKKLEPYRNGLYKIEEDVIKLNSVKNLYKAKIRSVVQTPDVFDNIVSELKKTEKTNKQIKVTLNNTTVVKIEELAKRLKSNRSSVIEKILNEALNEIEKRMSN